jgi:hypothetical protein
MFSSYHISAISMSPGLRKGTMEKNTMGFKAPLPEGAKP